MKKNPFLLAGIFLFISFSLVKAQTSITSNLDVGFVTEAAIENGSFRVLIPTVTDASNLGQSSGAWNNGVASATAFVFPTNPSLVTVTCPSSDGNFTFGTPAQQIGTIYYDLKANKELTQAEALAKNGDFTRYFGFICPYTGTGMISDQFAIGTNQIKINGLINPVLADGQTINEALVIPGKIQLLKNGYSATNTSGQVGDYLVSDRDVMISAFVHDVLVTAEIKAQITFEIRAVEVGETVCSNKTTTVASTPVSVDYQSPSIQTFTDAAQRIYVNSSASNGYVVTVKQDGNMSRQGATYCSNDGLIDATTINRDCIPNFGWRNSLSPLAGAAWTDPTNTGLGYTVSLKTDASTGTGTAPVASSIFAGGNYTRFATQGSNEAPVTIISSGKATDGDLYDACYRLSIDAQNNAGVYDNSITYTVTANF